MRQLFAMRYVTARGLRGMAQAPLVQLLAIATFAVCMLLLGTIVLVWSNARSIADRWGVDVPVTAYLVEDVTAEGTADLAARLGELPQVEQVDIVTPAQAQQRLVEGLGGDERLLEGIEAELLPTSLEIHVRGGDVGQSETLATELRAEPDVEDVVAAGQWAARAQSLLETLRRIAIGAAALVGFACLTIVWSTIRLAVYARRAEIQILRLVGGTASFVHGPFVVEGLVQGTLGAAAAVTMLYFGFDAVRPMLADAFALAFAAGGLRFLAPIECAALVGFGAALGVLGSRAAVARYVEG
ncbi:MAG: permease-like cell division protein FtsX [Nannocystaceae bacterium]